MTDDYSILRNNPNEDWKKLAKALKQSNNAQSFNLLCK